VKVPLSLEIKITVARGTLRLYVKPPPSDQIWFGFQSMPDMEWNIETYIGDRKITGSRVGLLIGNRFKVSYVLLRLYSCDCGITCASSWVSVCVRVLMNRTT
jgi:hypothetical protein